MSDETVEHRYRRAATGKCLKCGKVGLLCRGYCRRPCYHWALYHGVIKSQRAPQSNPVLLSKAETEEDWLSHQLENFVRQHARYFDYDGQRFLVLSEVQLNDLCRIIYTAKSTHKGDVRETNWAYYAHNRVKLKSDIEEGNGEYLDHPISPDVRAYRKVRPGI